MAEVGFFVPPAEDSSTIVLNHLAEKISNQTSNIRMVIFKVEQRPDERALRSERLQQKSYVHQAILEEEVFSFQKERGLTGNPDGILLCPELLAEKYPDRVRVQFVADPNDPAFVKQITENHAIKLAFSIRNLIIFQSNLIKAFNNKEKNSLINLHPARLLTPQKIGKNIGIRGLEGPFWTRVEGQTEYQTTMHVIDTGIDTGPIMDYRAKSVNGSASQPVSTYPREAATSVAEMIFHEIHLRLIMGSHRHPVENLVSKSVYHTLPTEKELDDAERRNIFFVGGNNQITWILRNFANETKDPEHYQELSQRVWHGYLGAGYTAGRKKRLSSLTTAAENANDQNISDPSNAL